MNELWGIKNLLIRSLLLGGVLFFVALLGNWLWPRGIEITKDYFPELPFQIQEKAIHNDNESTLSAKFINLQQSLQLWQSPDREAGLVIFLDARTPTQFFNGHIPGAYLFYHYRAEEYLPKLLPLCQMAHTIVIYCNGGDCKDSEFAAAILVKLGIELEKLKIFVGGFQEWKEAGLPVE